MNGIALKNGNNKETNFIGLGPNIPYEFLTNPYNTINTKNESLDNSLNKTMKYFSLNII